MPIYIPQIKVKYQSINVILKIKEYWNLIGQKLLTITWEPHFSQACTFPRILKDHNNFRFTPIRDKISDLIFLKSRKNLVFWPYLTIFDIILFSKKSCSVTCNQIWAPNTKLSVRKNKWANSGKTYGQTRGRTDYRADGQTEG